MVKLFNGNIYKVFEVNRDFIPSVAYYGGDLRMIRNVFDVGASWEDGNFSKSSNASYEKEAQVPRDTRFLDSGIEHSNFFTDRLKCFIFIYKCIKRSIVFINNKT